MENPTFSHDKANLFNACKQNELEKLRQKLGSIGGGGVPSKGPTIR